MFQGLKGAAESNSTVTEQTSENSNHKASNKLPHRNISNLCQLAISSFFVNDIQKLTKEESLLCKLKVGNDRSNFQNSGLYQKVYDYLEMVIYVGESRTDANYVEERQESFKCKTLVNNQNFSVLLLQLNHLRRYYEIKNNDSFLQNGISQSCSKLIRLRSAIQVYMIQVMLRLVIIREIFRLYYKKNHPLNNKQIKSNLFASQLEGHLRVSSLKNIRKQIQKIYEFYKCELIVNCNDGRKQQDLLLVLELFSEDQNQFRFVLENSGLFEIYSHILAKYYPQNIPKEKRTYFTICYEKSQSTCEKAQEQRDKKIANEKPPFVTISPNKSESKQLTSQTLDTESTSLSLNSARVSFCNQIGQLEAQMKIQSQLNTIGQNCQKLTKVKVEGSAKMHQRFHENRSVLQWKKYKARKRPLQTRMISESIEYSGQKQMETQKITQLKKKQVAVMQVEGNALYKKLKNENE